MALYLGKFRTRIGVYIIVILISCFIPWAIIGLHYQEYYFLGFSIPGAILAWVICREVISNIESLRKQMPETAKTKVDQNHVTKT
ncbi:MAG TPA: hypothetical protein VMC09_10805, partial [Anaerolineales bacterium]|nr:hypothetical protein [Anaerolineales bacterium]